jgi:hypothetical protein
MTPETTASHDAAGHICHGFAIGAHFGKNPPGNRIATNAASPESRNPGANRPLPDCNCEPAYIRSTTIESIS